MSNLVEIKKLLAAPASANQFKMALPAHITPERFQRSALTAVLTNSDILDCEPKSVMSALLKCAQDGLMPDGREAALVKYGSTAQYMPMVYGLIKRMRNSGDVKSVNAHIVYENDVFDYEIINGVESIRHKPTITGDRGKMLLTYAVIGFGEDTPPHVEVMMKEDVDKARNAGKAANSPAWKNWYDEMAKKSVLHRAAKRVPTSSDVVEFLREDMRMTLNGGFEDQSAPKTTLIDSINEAIYLDASAPPQNDDVIENNQPMPEDVRDENTPPPRQDDLLPNHSDQGDRE